MLSIISNFRKFNHFRLQRHLPVIELTNSFSILFIKLNSKDGGLQILECKLQNTPFLHQMALSCTFLPQLQHKTPSIGQVHKLSNRFKTNFDNLSSITIGLEAKERKREVWRKNSIGGLGSFVLRSMRIIFP